MKHKILQTINELQIFLSFRCYINVYQKQGLQPCFALGDADIFSKNNVEKSNKAIPQNQRKWVREEVVLLVVEYFRTRDMDPIERAESIDLISKILRKRAIINGETINEIFRNFNGIKMQFGCIISLDPIEREKGHKGLSGASSLQKEIVDEYLLNPEKLKMEAAAILRKYL